MIYSKDKILYYFFIIFISFSMYFIDLPIQYFFGTIGQSTMIFVSIITFFIVIIKDSFKYFRRPDVDLFAFYAFLPLFISIFILDYYILTTGNTHVYEKNLLIKTINTSMYNIVYFFLYYSFYRLSSHLNNDLVYKIIKILFYLLLLTIFLEYYQFDVLNLLHGFQADNERIRLMTPEPSQGLVIANVILLMNSVYLISENKKILNYMNILLLIIVNLLILSKAGILLIVLSFIIAYFFNTSVKTKLRTFPFFILLIVIAGLFINDTIFSMIEKDIDSFSSFATRASTLIASGISLVYYPLGEGYGTYLAFLPDLIEISFEWLQDVSGLQLNDYEILNIVNTGKNLAVKSGIGFQIVQTGILAIIFYIGIFVLTFKHININSKARFILSYLIIFLFLQILLGTNIEVMYIYILPIFYINQQYYEREGEN
jgi:hypothetical protein